MSFKSNAGSSNCHVGTGEIVAVRGKSSKSNGKSMDIKVKSLIVSAKTNGGASNSYDMEPERLSSVVFCRSKDQGLTAGSVINFVCTQSFTKNGPSNKNCLVLTEAEFKMSKVDKLSACNIPH